jgi:hypothetical protein
VHTIVAKNKEKLFLDNEFVIDRGTLLGRKLVKFIHMINLSTINNTEKKCIVLSLMNKWSILRAHL